MTLYEWIDNVFYDILCPFSLVSLPMHSFSSFISFHEHTPTNVTTFVSCHGDFYFDIFCHLQKYTIYEWHEELVEMFTHCFENHFE